MKIIIVGNCTIIKAETKEEKNKKLSTKDINNIMKEIEPVLEDIKKVDSKVKRV